MCRSQREGMVIEAHNRGMQQAMTMTRPTVWRSIISMRSYFAGKSYEMTQGLAEQRYWSKYLTLSQSAALGGVNYAPKRGNQWIELDEQMLRLVNSYDDYTDKHQYLNDCARLMHSFSSKLRKLDQDVEIV